MFEWLGAISCWAFLRPACDCHCSFETDKQVLVLLERQLDRCGPEQLAGKTPDSESFTAVAFVLGVAIGSLLTVCSYLLWSRIEDKVTGLIQAGPPAVKNTPLSAIAGPVTPSTRRIRA